MDRVTLANNDLLYREPARWSWLFTVPIFVVGAYFAVPVALGTVPECEEFTNPLRLLAIAGVLYLAWNANAWFGRLEFGVDESRQKLWRKWGLFFPLLGGSYPLKEYDTLRLSGIRTTHLRNGSVTHTEVTWYLHLASRKHCVLLGRADESGDVLRVGLEVAEAADLTLLDDTTDPPTTLRQSQRAITNLSPGAALLLALLAHAKSEPAEETEPTDEPESGIRFTCTSCSTELEFGHGAAGCAVRCRSCKNDLIVPAR